MLPTKAVHFRVVALFLLSTISQTGLRAQNTQLEVPLKALSSSTRRVVFESGAFTGRSTPLPRWENNYLVTRDIETFQEGVTNIRLYDAFGQKVREAAIWFPESQRVLIYSATATPDGRIIAAGRTEKADGATAPFIAFTDSAGKMTDVIQTKGFFPVNICQAPDGTVWSFGSTGYDEDSQPKPGGTLRHFDLRKGEVGSYLPRSAFPKRPRPEVKGYIHCSDSKIIVYSASLREYIEMGYGDDSPSEYHASSSSSLPLVGLAVTGSNSVYGYFSHAGYGGLYYLSCDEVAKTADWLPVKGTVGRSGEPGVIIGLWGSDGDKLVLSRGEDGAGLVALHWVSPVDQ
jgi:hypothetical protein